MPRSNYTVDIPQQRTIKSYGSSQTYTFTDAIHSKGVYTGVSRRKPKGWIPPTNWSLYEERWRRASGSRNAFMRSNPTRYYSKVTGCVGGNSPIHNTLNHFNEILSYTGGGVAPMDTTAAVIAARNRFKRFDLDLGVAYGERKRTAQHLGDTAKRLAFAARDLQRGNYRNALRRLGILSERGRPRGSNWTDHWLQYQYAWKPLLSDVYGACDALSKREKRDWRVTSKAFRSTDDVFTKNVTSWSGSAERHQGVFVRIDALPSNDLTMSLSSLGVLNPLSVAWELVPYSFVIDWFLPIGKWLDSLDALLGYTDIYQSVTTYTKTVYNGTGKYWQDASWDWNDQWTEWGEFVKIVRTASVGAPLPSFPRLKDPRSLTHMANGLSLLASAFGRTLDTRTFR